MREFEMAFAETPLGLAFFLLWLRYGFEHGGAMVELPRGVFAAFGDQSITGKGLLQNRAAPIDCLFQRP